MSLFVEHKSCLHYSNLSNQEKQILKSFNSELTGTTPPPKYYDSHGSARAL